MSDLTPDMLAMLRFDDGAIDMQEPLGCVAKQIANAVMDAEADQLCGGGANKLSRHYRQKAQKGSAGAGLGKSMVRPEMARQ